MMPILVLTGVTLSNRFANILLISAQVTHALSRDRCRGISPVIAPIITMSLTMGTLIIS